MARAPACQAPCPPATCCRDNWWRAGWSRLPSVSSASPPAARPGALGSLRVTAASPWAKSCVASLPRPSDKAPVAGIRERGTAPPCPTASSHSPPLCFRRHRLVALLRQAAHFQVACKVLPSPQPRPRGAPPAGAAGAGAPPRRAHRGRRGGVQGQRLHVESGARLVSAAIATRRPAPPAHRPARRWIRRTRALGAPAAGGPQAQSTERTPVHDDSIAIAEWFMDAHEAHGGRRR